MYDTLVRCFKLADSTEQQLSIQQQLSIIQHVIIERTLHEIVLHDATKHTLTHPLITNIICNNNDGPVIDCELFNNTHNIHSDRVIALDKPVHVELSIDDTVLQDSVTIRFMIDNFWTVANHSHVIVNYKVIE